MPPAEGGAGGGARAPTLYTHQIQGHLWHAATTAYSCLQLLLICNNCLHLPTIAYMLAWLFLTAPRGLSRERLHAVIVASCPVSYWISFDGDGAALRRRLAR